MDGVLGGMMDIFNKLNAVNVSAKVEKKAGLDYLSWAFAWAEVAKVAESLHRTVYETSDGCIYWTDGKTAWVKVGVSVNGVEHIDYLPVMDHRNKSIPLEQITSFEVNKAIQRSTVKALALHGLGLNIYAGEDLPLGKPDFTAENLAKLIPYAVQNGWDCDETLKNARLKYEVGADMEKELIKYFADMAEKGE
jgi:hypothetical protein